MIDPTAAVAAKAPAGGSEGLKDRALEVAATARESLSKGTSTVKAYIEKEPARALGIAVGLGVLLGWVIKRR